MGQENSEEHAHKGILMSEAQCALRCAQFFLALSESSFQLSQQLKSSSNGQSKEVLSVPRTKIIIKERKRQYGIHGTIRQKRQSSDESVSNYHHNKHEEKNAAPKYEKKGKKLKMSDKSKKMKDACIKRPIPAYIFYYRSQMKICGQKNPGMRINELTKVIAEDWKKLSNSEKQPYFKKAFEAREIYMKQKNQLFGEKNKVEIRKNEKHYLPGYASSKSENDSVRHASENHIDEESDQFPSKPQKKLQRIEQMNEQELLNNQQLMQYRNLMGINNEVQFDEDQGQFSEEEKQYKEEEDEDSEQQEEDEQDEEEEKQESNKFINFKNQRTQK